MVEKVIPQALNYADLKPEAIENEIKLVRYTPTATVNNAKQNDIIKFFLQGNGFYDPYSAYIKLTVTCSDLAAGEIRFLDRSAHSFINRLVIRSQGVEIERIEQYDVMAGMINDVIYSQEQQILHGWEGFPQQRFQRPWFCAGPGNIVNSNVRDGAGVTDGTGLVGGSTIRSNALQLLKNNASPIVCEHLGETAFYDGMVISAAKGNNTGVNLTDSTIIKQRYLDFGFYTDGARTPLDFAPAGAAGDLQIGAQNTYTFIIPIYSGILGILMPDKKLLPLSLMPLEVEFSLNPHALYSSLQNGSRNYTVSKFEIYAHTLFFEQEVHRALEAVTAEQGIFIHFNSLYLAPVTAMSTTMPGFAQLNMHFKSINAIHFVFLYNLYESAPFYRKLNFMSHNLTKLFLRNGSFLLPSEPIEGASGTSYQNQHVQYLVEMYKSWNKLHDPTMDGLIQPNNYCEDDAESVTSFFGSLVDGLGTRTTENLFIDYILLKQGTVGRCQYGISLEGEELGQDHTTITGRKALLPFDINLTSSAINGQPVGGAANNQIVSYMFSFLRCDFVVYVRPDLVVTVLGR